MTRAAFVNRTYASRITSVPVAAIARVECWANVVLVVFVKGLGLRPRFVSAKAFEADALSFRKAGADKLPSQIEDLGNDLYRVQGSKGNQYECDYAVASCTCEDSRRHGDLYSCKHLVLIGKYLDRKAAEIWLLPAIGAEMVEYACPF
jgi:hypothetical protein